MRGRKKEPEGKRITVCTKVSEPTAALIDEARGELTRSAWLQGLIADKLAAEASLTGRWHPAAASENVPVVALVAAMASRPKNCKHPKVRVKGTCPDCYEYVPRKP